MLLIFIFYVHFYWLCGLDKLPNLSEPQCFHPCHPWEVMVWIKRWHVFHMGFSDSSVGKESACNAGDPVQFLGLEHPLEKG